MRLLVGARPEIDVFVIVVLTVELKRARLGPGGDDQVVGLLIALVREGRVEACDMVFGADAAYEAGDDAPARQVVEHREFFGDEQRIVHQRQRAPEDRDLHPLGALDQGAGDQVRRRHHAVGGLVMLVHRDRIKAELFGGGQLIDVGLVFIGAFDRVIQAVGQDHPG
jgi:hypothetical protein